MRAFVWLLCSVCVLFSLTCLGFGFYSMFFRHNPFGVPDGVLLLLCVAMSGASGWLLGYMVSEVDHR